MAAAASTPAQALPTPEAANSSQSSSGGLFCPTSLDGQDRAVPWMPLFLAKLSDPIPVNGSNVNTSTAASSNSLQRSLSCGQWLVLMRDEQTAALPNGCEAAASGPAADSTSTGPGFFLEGDGGWGVYRTLYPAPQRAALRQWVVDAVRQAAREANSSGNAAAAATGLNVSFVLAASKILQDQAALALSALEEVPGAEVWEILQAAVNATVAAGAALGNGAAGTAGFGTVLYTLLMPLLPAVEVLSDRAGSSACWMHQQVGRHSWAGLQMFLAVCLCGNMVCGRKPSCMLYTADIECVYAAVCCSCGWCSVAQAAKSQRLQLVQCTAILHKCHDKLHC